MTGLPRAAVGPDIYRGRNQHANEYSDYNLGSIFVDLTQPGLTGNQGLLIDQVHGRWLYVDPSSVGAPLATFYNESDDSKSFVLSPGQVIDTDFDKIRVFSSPAAIPALLAPGQLSNPGLRLFYGEAECPFDSISNAQGSMSPVAYNVATVSGNFASTTYTALNMPSGALVDVSADASQVTGAAETSILRCRLILTFVNGATMGLIPDSEYAIDVATAGAGTARVQANWSSQRLPRGVVSLAVQVVNNGNAATNAILQGPNGQTVIVG